MPTVVTVSALQWQWSYLCADSGFWITSITVLLFLQEKEFSGAICLKLLHENERKADFFPIWLLSLHQPSKASWETQRAHITTTLFGLTMNQFLHRIFINSLLDPWLKKYAHVVQKILFYNNSNKKGFFRKIKSHCLFLFMNFLLP